MKRTNLLLIFVLCSVLVSYGQYSNKYWTFGFNCGLNFNQLSGGYPTPFSGCQIYTQEGAACISDENGNFLFYTDGMSLWDYNNNSLSSTLYGNFSSTSSAIIVPNPALNANNSRDYYVFTVDAWGACSWTNPVGHGIYYSVVNVNFNAPFSVTIVQQNIPLSTGICFRENLTAVMRTNNPGYWIISKQYAVNNSTGSNAFYVWEVTSTGVNLTPQIYNVGSVQSIGGSAPGSPSGNGSQGYLKISPDGSTLAMANSYTNYIELYHFNTTTGEVLPYVSSGNTILTNMSPHVYGIEFSPNSQLLYISGTYNGIIYQFDLSNVNIASTMQALSPVLSSSSYYVKGAIQLGPDNKIYVSKSNSQYLAVINNPNTIGNGCNLIDNAVTLSSGALCQNGLPTFIPTKIQVVSTNNIEKEKLISVYPNPCIDKINFDYPSEFELIVNLTDINNKILLTKTLSKGQREINLENFPNAIYFVRIYLVNQNKQTIDIINRKIVKISE